MSRRRKFRNQFYLRRSIIPLNVQNGTYSAQYVDLRKLDNFCTLEEIQKIIDEIHYTTKNMAPIRIYTRFFTWSLFFHFLFVFTGLIIQLSVYQGMEQYGIGLYIIFSAFGILFGINIYACYNKNNQIKSLYSQIDSVINKYRDSFKERGLRWEIMKNCQWLELWNDNKLERDNREIGAENANDLANNYTVNLEKQYVSYQKNQNSSDGLSTRLISSYHTLV